MDYYSIGWRDNADGQGQAYHDATDRENNTPMNTQQAKHTPGPWQAKEQYLSHTTNETGYFILWPDTSKPGVCWKRLDDKYGKGGVFKEADAKLLASAPALLEALQRIAHEADDLFKLAEDSIIHDGDSWSCRACGMELDTGEGHRDNCCASAIFDFGKAIHFAEETLASATIQAATQSGKGEA